MNFSVILIGRNEEKTVPRLAASLAAFLQAGGEVVLVDTGSSDGTAQVARDAGFKVFEVGERFATTLDEATASAINAKADSSETPVVMAGDRVFDFSAARNFSAECASNDMVLSIDCDEVFTALDFERLQKQIDKGVTRIHYDYVNAHDEHGRETAKWQRTEFYDRRYYKWYGLVHEAVWVDVGANEYVISVAPFILKIEHFKNNETNRSSYLRGLALEALRNPESARAAHYYGRELYYAGKKKSALNELARHGEMVNVWEPEQNESLVLCGDICRQLGRDKDALDYWHKAIQADGARRAPWLRIAGYYFDRGDAQRTASYAAASLQVTTRRHYADWAWDMQDRPHRLLYWALWKLGRKEESRVHYDLAYGFNPKDQTYIKERKFFYPNG